MNPTGLVLGLAVFLAGSASAENVGLSYLGICNPTWPCESSLNAFRYTDIIRTGWIEQTFGSRCTCADELLQDERPKEIRVHLANGPCLRNARCGRGEVFYGFSVASANRDLQRPTSTIAKRFEKLAKRLKERLQRARGALICYISPIMEADIRERQRLTLHRIAGAYLPNCTLVDNPHKRPCLPDTVCEQHGPTVAVKPPCITDLDGVSAYDTHVPTYLRSSAKCDLSFLWTHGFNCNKQGESFSGEPSKRDCRGVSNDIERLVKWLRTTFR